MMKKTIQFIACTFAFLMFIQDFNLQAQNNQPPVLEDSDTTFFAIYEKLNTYYSNQAPDPDPDIEEGSERNNFYRWANFWRNRLDDNAGFKGASIAMSEFLNNDLGNLCTSEEDDDIIWEELGPFNSDGSTGSGGCTGNLPEFQNQGRIESISVDQNHENNILAGGSNGGIWRSINGGMNWHNTTDDEGYSITGTTIMVRNPEKPNIVYASTSSYLGPWDFGHDYGFGIIKSTDDGESWTQTDYAPNYGGSGRVLTMTIDPNSTQDVSILYFASVNKVYRYIEDINGTTIDILYQDDDNKNSDSVRNLFTGIEVDIDGDLWFCYGKGLWRIEDPMNAAISSDDFPEGDADQIQLPEPTDITNIDKKVIRMDINKQGDIVMSVNYGEIVSDSGIDEVYFYRKTYGETDWEMKEITFEPSEIVLDPYDSDIVYFEARNPLQWCMTKTLDFGDTFQTMNNSENHTDIRTLDLYDLGGTDYTIYVGTDGGLSRLEPDLVTWRDITGEGIANTNNFGLGITEQNDDFIFLGAQDGNINFYNDGEWYQTNPGGDNGDCIINPKDYTAIFQQTQNVLYRTNLNGTLDNTISGSYPDPPGDDWIYPLYLNPNDDTELFAATDRLCGHKDAWTTNGSWTEYSLPGKFLSSIVISENNNNLIFYALDYYKHSHGTDPNAGGVFICDRTNILVENIDISGNLKPNLQAPISGITVDPLNENRVWISMGGLKDGYRVFKTENATTNVDVNGDGRPDVEWEDISGCLPKIPINNIVYQKQTNDRLYIGTDFGVFYKDANMTDWVHYADGGPGCAVVDMHINYCSNKLVVASQGRGLWKADLLPAKETELVFGGGGVTVIWDTETKLLGDVRIGSGTTLKIVDTDVLISENVKIIIEPGGLLDISNSKLTNNCGEFWDGIQVRGNPTEPQLSNFQGKLVIRDNSIIEYAANAVKLGGNTQADYHGGIVHARNSTFRNNARAAEFLQYRNFSINDPTTTLSNVSYFEDCIFIIDETLADGQNPLAFISMWDVDNVSIRACSFSNTNPDADTREELGTGIGTINASFSVGCTGICTSTNPCCNNDPSTFTNLGYGIKARNSSSNKTFSVRNSEFKDCIYGIVTRNINYFKVVNNTFEMGYSPSLVADNYGVYSSQGTQFQIEENSFFKSILPGSNAKTGGTVIFDTGLDNNDNNEVYKNTFNNLYAANWALGDNNADIPDEFEFNGLAYFCNTQNNSSFGDINAGWYGSGLRTNFIDMNDEGNGLSAGNIFTNDALVGGESSFKNEMDQNINYFYGTDLNEFPEYTTAAPKFNKSPALLNGLDENTCPSNLTKSKSQLVQNYEEEKINYEHYLLEWTTKRDTASEVVIRSNIQSAANNDLSLKTTLLDKSPYLSAETIEFLVESDKFDEQHLFEVLAANPEAVRQSDAVDSIELHQTLSVTNIIALKDTINRLSERGLLEVQMTNAAAARDFYNTSYIRIVAEQDTLSNIDLQDIDNRLGNFNSTSGYLAQIDLEYNRGNKTVAIQNLQDMTNQFNFSPTALIEYNDLQKLYELMYQASTESRNEYELTINEIDELKDLAEHGKGIAQIRAQNILSFFYGIEYDLDIPLPGSGSGSSSAMIQSQDNTAVQNTPKKKKKERISSQVEVEITPNPADEQLRINYHSPSIYGNTGSIKIVSSGGKAYFSETIDAQEKEFILDSSEWPSGMYYGIYTNQNGKHKIIPFMVYH